MVKNLPLSAGDAGLVPEPGIARATEPQNLRPTLQSLRSRAVSPDDQSSRAPSLRSTTREL